MYVLQDIKLVVINDKPKYKQILKAFPTLLSKATGILFT